MDLAKIKAIQKQKTPTNIYDILSFLGFYNFYYYFIRNFSIIAKPLTEISKGITNQKLSKIPLFLQTKIYSNIFRDLKATFDLDIILSYFDPALPTWVETNSLDWVVVGILS